MKYILPTYCHELEPYQVLLRTTNVHGKPLLSSAPTTEDFGEGAAAPHGCGQGICSLS